MNRPCHVQSIVALENEEGCTGGHKQDMTLFHDNRQVRPVLDHRHLECISSVNTCFDSDVRVHSAEQHDETPGGSWGLEVSV